VHVLHQFRTQLWADQEHQSMTAFFCCRVLWWNEWQRLRVWRHIRRLGSLDVDTRVTVTAHYHTVVCVYDDDCAVAVTRVPTSRLPRRRACRHTRRRFRSFHWRARQLKNAVCLRRSSVWEGDSLRDRRTMQSNTSAKLCRTKMTPQCHHEPRMLLRYDTIR